MVKIDIKSASAANDSSIAGGKKKNIQIEIFPQRLLNFESAQKLIDEPPVLGPDELPREAAVLLHLQRRRVGDGALRRVGLGRQPHQRLPTHSRRQ